MLQTSGKHRRFCLSAFVLALLATLLLAAGAHAEASLEGQEPSAGTSQETQQPAQEGGGAGGEAPDGGSGEQAPPTSVETPVEVPAVEAPPVETPVEVPTVEVPSVEVPAVEVPPVQAPPVEGSPVEVPAEVPAAEVPPVEAPPVEVPAVEVPPVEAPVEVPVVDAPPVEAPPVEVPAVEAPPAEAGPAEASSGAPPREAETTSSRETPEEPTQGKSGESSEEAGLVSDGGSSLHTPSGQSPATEPSARAGLTNATLATVTAPIAEVAERAQTSPKARGAVATMGMEDADYSCGLSSLGGDMTNSCTAGWLTSSRDPASAPTVAAVAEVSSLVPAAPRGNWPSDGGRGGPSSADPPATPSPGSAPSGASGAVAGGASGSGVSIFLTLAGLLLLGAPRVLRRLWLSFEPWLAGCLVLIPEHPD